MTLGMALFVVGAFVATGVAIVVLWRVKLENRPKRPDPLPDFASPALSPAKQVLGWFALMLATTGFALLTPKEEALELKLKDHPEGRRWWMALTGLLMVGLAAAAGLLLGGVGLIITGGAFLVGALGAEIFAYWNRPMRSGGGDVAVFAGVAGMVVWYQGQRSAAAALLLLALLAVALPWAFRQGRQLAESE